MKIQLERKLISCPDRVMCAVCRQLFSVGQIRALLHNDKGLIQGDVCPECLELENSEIKQRLQDRASLLMKQANMGYSRTDYSRQLAEELLEVAQENVEFPPFYQWLVKWFEVLFHEPEELEITRSELLSRDEHRRSRF